MARTKTGKAIIVVVVAVVGVGAFLVWGWERVGRAQEAPAEVKVTLSLLVRKNLPEGSQLQNLEPKMTLSSRDQIKAVFSADAKCHVYVFEFGETNGARVLCPHPPQNLVNPLPGNTTHVLPPDPDWHPLRPAGTGHLCFIAALSPAPELDRLAARIAGQGEDTPEARAKLSREVLAGLNQLFLSRGVGKSDAEPDVNGVKGFNLRSIGSIGLGPERELKFADGLEGKVKSVALQGHGLVAMHVVFLVEDADKGSGGKWTVMVCPWCGGVNRIYDTPSLDVWTCAWCGNMFSP